ncbi:MAG: 7-cyano-7-deazaguanine synthase QueC [Candidatus Omnitrophica bacterium]|nr:7-cyano-7-deazaguanine synthase QueC [Candidatus Omnitrophota bacterium]
MTKKKAVVLLSGGVDSATTLFMAKEKGYECLPLIFDYGQRHKRELESAKKISDSAGCRHKVLKIELPWKGSALLNKKKKLPNNRSFKEIKKGIPSTYVPARNTIFLSFALSYAEAIGAYKIFIGANAVDFSGYPDCRPAFLKAFENVIRDGTRRGMEGKRIAIEAPLILKTKSQIIEEGERLKVPYEYTWSCYAGESSPCGNCDSCIIRKKGFEGAGIKDPLVE